jgi:hypothetical protein
MSERDGAGAPGTAVKADTTMRARELWVPAVIALFVAYRWLLGERHSVYGDEAFHLTNLFEAIAALRGSAADRFVSLYLFNFAYPPMFHLLSAPFVLPAADPVFGGRVYTQVLTLLGCLTLYAVTRPIGGKLAGAVAVMTLLAMPSFVDPSRHYLLEPLLILEVLLILRCLALYYERPRGWLVAALAALVSVGLLTKFNFFFYAAPLFLLPAIVEIHGLITRRREWTTTAALAAAMIVVPLAVAGPWYLSRAAGSTGMLTSLYDAGTLKAGVSFEAIRPLLVRWFTLNYSLLFRGVAVVAAVIYAAHVLRIPQLRAWMAPMTRPQHIVLAGAFAGILIVPVILAFVGLAGELRWHIEAVYLVVLTTAIVGRLTAIPRVLALAGLCLAAGLQLIVMYVGPIGGPGFLFLPIRELIPRPSTVPVGSEALASDITRYEARTGGTKPGEFVFFFYHEHAGPHFGSVEFYLKANGTPLTTRIAGFFDRAIDVGNIFDAKYLIEGAGRSAEWADPENRRYRLLVQHLPREFRDILVEVSTVSARFGTFRAYYVPHDRITRDMVLTTIDAGRGLETVESNLILWDAQRAIWRARFEPVPGNASLRADMEDVLARVPASARKLSMANRVALDAFIARIQELRRLVDTKPPETAPATTMPREATRQRRKAA